MNNYIVKYCEKPSFFDTYGECKEKQVSKEELVKMLNNCFILVSFARFTTE